MMKKKIRNSLFIFRSHLLLNIILIFLLAVFILTILLSTTKFLSGRQKLQSLEKFKEQPIEYLSWESGIESEKDFSPLEDLGGNVEK